MAKKIKEIQTNAEYQSTPLFALEYDVMMELERLIGKPIPSIPAFSVKKFGFVATDGHVTALGLPNQGLTSLPETFGDLIYLEDFNLSSWKTPTQSHLNQITALVRHRKVLACSQTDSSYLGAHCSGLYPVRGELQSMLRNAVF